MKRMRIRGSGYLQLLAVFCAGLATVLAAGSAAAVLDRPAPAVFHAGHGSVSLAVAPAGASPADLAVRLQALLGQHSVLAADLMRSRIRGDDNFVQAANAALGQNTDAMTDLVGQLFGAAAGQQFGSLWSQHVVALFAYAGAVADQDADARNDARKQLTEFEGKLAAFFAGASHGRLSPAAARAAVDMHVAHLTMQADAYAAHDYAAADRLYRESYQHTYDLGLSLADALLPAADRQTLQAPIWRLRSQLGKLLAEHAVLVEDVTRAAVTNTPDFAAAGDMINGNTQDLSAAVDTLFGAAAAKRFQSLWASHVEELVAYAGATASGATGRRQQAQADLHQFETGMAAVLAPATGGRMTQADLSAALQVHDQMLLRHADAYAAKNYQSAQNLANQTYDHMFDLARQLADGFGATVAARLPKGGAQTGYGGLADVVENR
jgi:hypothetical protein